jgi:hypothetical protein
MKKLRRRRRVAFNTLMVAGFEEIHNVIQNMSKEQFQNLYTLRWNKKVLNGEFFFIIQFVMTPRAFKTPHYKVFCLCNSDIIPFIPKATLFYYSKR